MEHIPQHIQEVQAQLDAHQQQAQQYAQQLAQQQAQQQAQVQQAVQPLQLAQPLQAAPYAAGYEFLGASSEDGFSASIGGCSILYGAADNGISLEVSAPTSGWLGFGFPSPSSPTSMIGTFAVIGSVNDAGEPSIGRYELNAKDVSGIVASDGIEFSDLTVTEAGGEVTINAVVPYGDRVEAGSASVPMLCAYSEEGNDALSYHGSTRAAGELDLSCLS